VASGVRVKRVWPVLGLEDDGDVCTSIHELSGHK
jgi:hypothetical protein